MREIKFRVWDGDKYFSLSEAMSLDLLGVQFNRADSFGLEPYYDFVVIEQFTGLKDKNGVEIYEGDLVKTKHVKHVGENTEIHYKTGKIKYHNTYKYGLCLMWNKGHMDIFNYLQISRCDGEVIGNIHDTEVYNDLSE